MQRSRYRRLFGRVRCSSGSFWSLSTLISLVAFFTIGDHALAADPARPGWAAPAAAFPLVGVDRPGRLTPEQLLRVLAWHTVGLDLGPGQGRCPACGQYAPCAVAAAAYGQLRELDGRVWEYALRESGRPRRSVRSVLGWLRPARIARRRTSALAGSRPPAGR